MRRRRYAVLSAVPFSVVMAVLVALAAPASAMTWEQDYAVSGNVPQTKTCVSTTGAKACFHADGDVWWVKDTASNGYMAEARWYDLSYEGPVNGSNNEFVYELHRYGACIEYQGVWGKCGKDYKDSSDPDAGYRSDKLVWRACNVDGSGGLHGCSGSCQTDSDGTYRCSVGIHEASGGPDSGSAGFENWFAHWPPKANQLYECNYQNTICEPYP